MIQKITFLPFFITASFLLFCCSANCQLLFSTNHKRYVVKTVNVEDGLINNSVSDIVTDTFGFTWIAAKTGLQRYNGYRLETIHPNINGKEVNISYQVHFLKTKNNLLWITYQNGILVYNPFLGKFSSLIRLPSSSVICPLRPLQQTSGGIWCINEKGFLLYTENGKLLKEIHISYASVIQPLLSLKFQYTANTNSIFIITAQNDVMAFNKATETYTLIHFKNENLYSLTCTETKLYISHNKGISTVRIGSNEPPEMYKVFGADKFSFGTIRVVHNEILASINQHLLALDSNCKSFHEITTLGSNPILPAGFINAIYEDQFNRLWLLTNDDIKIIQNYTIPFQYFAYPNANNFIKCVYVDEAKNKVLAGCFNGGIELFDTLNNALWKSPLLSVKAKDIVCIEKLKDDTYFFETIGQGWYLLHLSAKQIVPFPISEKQESELHTRSIGFPNNIQKIDSNNFIITTPFDVFKCTFNKENLYHFIILFRAVNNNFINVFCFNQNNNCLWVGTSTGMLYCKHPNGKTDAYNIPDNYQVRSIVADAQNNIWAGTDKGLFVYNNGKLIKTFSTSNGLLNDCIYSMLTDEKKQTIYASSNLGLSAIKLSGVLKNYTKESGLQENEFNTSAIAKTSLGKLFFGGVNGITAFYPSDITTEPDHPSLLIYKTEINDKPFSTDSAIWNAHHYHLSYDENKISFSLTAFGLQNASGYSYEYKMENFDKYWTTTNNPTNISYHLPPGNYKFKARMVNFPSVTIIQNIHIAAPFWEQWWFYVLCLSFVFLLLLGAARTVYQRRYKAKLQTLRIRQQVLAERERISRDLHDNIGAYASAISANVDDIIYQFNASDHAILQRLKDSAREIIVQLRDSIWALNKENQTVIMLSDRIKNYVQKLQPTYPDIAFDVDENIEQNITLASITALHVLRIVQEAVHNAIKHSGCSGIRISISSCSPLIISITDNGSGMPDAPVYGEGLKNMQARAIEVGWQVTIMNKQTGCCVQLRNTN